MTQDRWVWKLFGGIVLLSGGLVLLFLYVFDSPAFRMWAAPIVSLVLASLVVIGAADGYYNAGDR